MNHPAEYKFHGDGKRHKKDFHEDSPKKAEPYVVSDELVEVVNLALYLNRPLLLEGEAGCGKTRLARVVAYELGLPFYTWNIRSTSKVEEGLYTYDAIGRLHDAQLVKVRVESRAGSEMQDPSKAEHYIKYGALGRAFQLDKCPAVVLIDEIDKANVDFPNDLLTLLDEPREFTIRETGATERAKYPPIVIITSNKEKGDLPAPFLRRCIYHYIHFPGEEELKKIVKIHHENGNLPSVPDDLVDAAAERFLGLRDDKGLYKRPSTSEFLDWVNALGGFTSPPYSPSQLDDQKVLPYPGLLLKLRSDWHRVKPNP